MIFLYRCINLYNFQSLSVKVRMNVTWHELFINYPHSKLAHDFIISIFISCWERTLRELSKDKLITWRYTMIHLSLFNYLPIEMSVLYNGGSPGVTKFSRSLSPSSIALLSVGIKCRLLALCKYAERDVLFFFMTWRHA